jgi:DNA recombination protein RmuC
MPIIEPWIIAAGLAGVLLGALLVLLLRPDRSAALAAAAAAGDAARTQAAALAAELAAERAARGGDRQQLAAQAKELGSLTALLAEARADIAAREEQFRQLASEAVAVAAARVVAQSREGLDPIIAPVREQLAQFRTRVDQVYEAEARERIRLGAEIAATLRTAQAVGTQADALARALTAQSQVRGHMGEVMLEQVLQAAGLEPDVSYVVQGKGLDIRAEDGSRQRPDVIVTLTDGKCLIIDSKVALVDYVAFHQATDAPGRDRALAAFRTAVQRHATDLARKHYPAAVKARTTDFVLMFMPFEAALTLAMQADPDLFATAWEKGVAIVGPNTLLMAMRVVAQSWATEKSRRSVSEVLETAAKLHDQLAAASDSFAASRAAIERALAAHTEGTDRIFEMRGSVRAHARKLQELGVRARRGLADPHDADTAEAAADAPEPPALPPPA